VPRDELDGHVCDDEQRMRYERFQVRVEAERFDNELSTWLESLAGRFAVYYAERQRRAA
jgi:hypothetical protein